MCWQNLALLPVLGCFHLALRHRARILSVLRAAVPANDGPSRKTARPKSRARARHPRASPRATSTKSLRLRIHQARSRSASSTIVTAKLNGRQCNDSTVQRAARLNSRSAPLERLDPRLSRHRRILRPQIGCFAPTAISPARVATEFEPVFRRYSRSTDVDHLDLMASRKGKKTHGRLWHFTPTSSVKI